MSSAFSNALKEAWVQRFASSCLPALPCKPARSFTYRLLVKASTLRVITKSMETGALAELGKEACSLQDAVPTQEEALGFPRPRGTGSTAMGRARETLLALRRGREPAAPHHRLVAGLCCVGRALGSQMPLLLSWWPIFPWMCPAPTNADAFRGRRASPGGWHPWGGGEGRSWARQLRTCFQLQTGANRTRR